jgi:hypothetical protein
MTPAVLVLYRQDHKIEPVEDFDQDFGYVVLRCAHDHLRIVGKAGGGFRHDPSEIQTLAKIERGETA